MKIIQSLILNLKIKMMYLLMTMGPPTMNSDLTTNPIQMKTKMTTPKMISMGKPHLR